jgi:hypothetical protein
VFTAVAWQYKVRRCDANSDSFTARLSSAQVGYPRHGMEKTPLRLIASLRERVSMLQFLQGVNTPQYDPLQNGTFKFKTFPDMIKYKQIKCHILRVD